MVVIPYKVKQSVHYYTVQLLIETASVMPGIVPDTVHTYEQVSAKNVSFAVIEGYNVGVIAVIQKLTVYLKQVVVGAENHGYLPDFLPFVFGNALEPSAVEPPFLEHERCILPVVPYHFPTFSILCKITTNKSKNWIL